MHFTVFSLPLNFKWSHIITQDVAVIGRGSGGIYSATDLKDQGKYVIVVQSREEVALFMITCHGSASFLAKTSDLFEPPMYHDFRTGKEFKVSYDDHHNYDIAAVSTAMDALNKARNQWPQLHSGTFLPSPVPVELYR
ncbi:hypothetical protein J3E71DRAFT_338617 [Bipolaris maydis]|nr:hypothetical protein J3E73DRAFT_366250 [Bipolaris maydis]KAJ6286458.1 hypothetical protein J3E71DRAFT_338617 [Bipolaris maydis]